MTQGQTISHSETILVVDDDRSVRTLLEKLLARAGYQVRTASDGLSALQEAEHDDSIGIILLDVSMPGLSATESVQRLGEILPKARILIVSGHSADEVRKKFSTLNVVGVVQKPFKMAQLLEWVRSV